MNLESRRRRILEEVRRGITQADEEEQSAQSRVRAAREMRRVLERAEKSISEISVAEAKSVSPIEASRKIAGERAVAQVESILQTVGRTTQSEVTKATGLNSGTVSHALRVLEAEGKARKTGRRHGRSDEWMSLAKGRAARAA